LLEQALSELVELLSSPCKDNPQGRHLRLLRRLPHIKSKQVVRKNASRFLFAPFQEFLQNHLHLQGSFEMLEINFSGFC